MCGIVGAIGKIYTKEEDVFKLLLKLDTVRGEHSTGICSVVKEQGMWQFQKMVGTPFDLLATKDCDQMMTKRCHTMLFGHNRQATRGEISDDNAHPFHHDHIVGCHNGTIMNTTPLKDHAKFKVDSDNIFYDIAHNGVKTTVQKINGPFVLCWYDAREHTLNITRNKERPMFYCYTKDHKTLFWASESWMLHVALSRCELARDEIVPLEDGLIFTVDVPVIAGSSVDTVQHRQEAVEFYKAPVLREESAWDSWDDWKGSRGYGRGGSTYTPYKAPETGGQKTSPSTGKVIDIGSGRSTASLAARFLGKVVTFSVAGKGKQGNLEHIKCDIEDMANPPELRIFTDSTSQLGVELLNSPLMFQGKVKSITGNGGDAYVLVDHRSIKVVTANQMLLLEGPIDDSIANQGSVQDYADSLKDAKHTGFQGKLLTVEEYARLTQDGCSLCGDYAALSGKDKIVWFDRTGYFCEKCAELEFAQTYLNTAQIGH